MIRKFALIFGILFVIAGLAGFIPALTPHHSDMSPIAVDAFYGRVLGLFPVNILHNLVHLAIGAWGLVASRSVAASRTYGRVLAVFYGLLAVLGLIPTAATKTMFGLIPIYGNDIWLHGLSALIAAYFGFVAKSDENDRNDS